MPTESLAIIYRDIQNMSAYKISPVAIVRFFTCSILHVSLTRLAESDPAFNGQSCVQ